MDIYEDLDVVENRKKLKSTSFRENGHSEMTKSLAYKETGRNVGENDRSDRRQYMDKKARQTEEAAKESVGETVSATTRSVPAQAR